MDNGSVLCSPPVRTTKDLSSAERCVQMDAMIAHLNAVTRQVNAVTAQLRAADARASAAESVCQERWDTTGGIHMSLDKQHRAFQQRPLLARLRWLVLGR